jgi:LmbE family N-acetylglucosaminyl deacetylase
MNATFTFLDLDHGAASTNIAGFFEGLTDPRAESIIILSPHDDDALLGAGYAIIAALQSGARVHVVIFHAGDAGYSIAAEKETIIATRRLETIAAYKVLGLRESNITRLELPDFSGNAYVGHKKPGKGNEAIEAGTFRQMLVLLRKLKATRVLAANGFREHIDHVAVADTGIFYTPQVGDPVVVDWAEPWPVKTFMEYSVWGGFDPVESMRRNAAPDALPANRVIVAPDPIEQQVQAALREYRSQQAIIKGILDNRRERKIANGYLELYMEIDPRPKLDYLPYKQRVDAILKNKQK